jgi:Zn-dependent peptidase ImmA (M78 family)/predicted secreted protein
MNLRQEVLKATREAASIQARFPVGQRASFDVVGAAAELGVPILFRPLDKLWGAFIVVRESPGVLVTTTLDLPIQRFTLAHELGHYLLQHGTHLDNAQTISFAARFAPASHPVEERAADTFASELLTSKSLMLATSRRHGWKKDSLADPTNVYQLALRLGVSFQAACWGLAAQKVISQRTATELSDYPVKSLKLALAPRTLITNPWGNVWRLTEADAGSFLEAAPDDLFAVDLCDQASSGFLWELVDSGQFARVVEERTDVGTTYGGPTSRTVFLRFDQPGAHRLVFEHRRPWSNETLSHIDIQIANYGKEQPGLARQVRERALALELA